jgi:hypothetical protein
MDPALCHPDHQRRGDQSTHRTRRQPQIRQVETVGKTLGKAVTAVTSKVCCRLGQQKILAAEEQEEADWAA